MLTTLLAAKFLLAIEPPMVRKWTTFVAPGTEIVGSEGGICFYKTRETVGAVDEATGKNLWSKVLSAVFKVKVGQGLVLVSTYDGKFQTFLALDPKTGAEAHRQNFDQVRQISIEPNRIIAVDWMKANILTRDFKLIATVPICGRNTGADYHIALEGDILASTLSSHTWVVVDLKTKKRLWQRKDDKAGTYPIIMSRGLLLLNGESGGVYEARTGKLVWKLNSATWSALSGDTCLSREKNDYVARDWMTGKELWRRPMAPEDARLRSRLWLSEDGKTFLADGARMTAFSPTGEVRWTAPVEGPMIAGEDRWVAIVDGRMMGYRRGKLPAIPESAEERKKLAEAMVKDFEFLDERERDLLIQLRKEALDPLLKRFVRWAKGEEPDRPDLKFTSENFFLDRRVLGFDGLYSFMKKMVTKEDVPALVNIVTDLDKSRWNEELFIPLIIEHGDIEALTPLFLERVRERGPRAAFNLSVPVVVLSRHPDAIKFMIDALNDDAPYSMWRREAALHIGEKGGAEGSAALKRLGYGPGIPSRWLPRMPENFAELYKDSKVAKDKKGRTWVLFNDDALGDSWDVYIAELKGTKLERPTYLGFSEMIEFAGTEPQSYRGMAVKEIIEKEWINMFPDDPAIRRDSDKDGLPDLVEAKFGLNPKSADTDGDGLRDDVDRCPNAAPRPLGDREKIVAAALAFRYFDRDNRTPSRLTAPDMEPFETYSNEGVLVWNTPEARRRSGKVSGRLRSISFRAPWLHFIDQEPKDGDWIQFSEGGTKAVVELGQVDGPLSGSGERVTLIKLRGEWFVVSSERAWIS
ncbi:MAG: PQQ-binding-like beta-propeller repeat protein [Armatimonadetes bacterium]|nr:PQQ-binding-like beta-propeller repeat protein [Armatimonadota bacterium]